MKRTLLFLSFATARCLYSMNPTPLFPTSTPAQFIWLSRALHEIPPANQHEVMRTFLAYHKLRHRRALKNETIIQQEITGHRRLICALAAVFSKWKYPDNLPAKSLYTFFDKPIDRRAFHSKLERKAGLDGEQSEELLRRIEEMYDMRAATRI